VVRARAGGAHGLTGGLALRRFRENEPSGITERFPEDGPEPAARNCPQLLKPRACSSTFCSLTAFSNSPRENTFNTCEKMLHTFSRLSFLTLNWFLTGTHTNVLGIHLSPAATASVSAIPAKWFLFVVGEETN